MNKVSTAVQLRFNIIRSPSLSPEVKQRLARLAGKRVTEAGDLVIEAHTYRTQEQNKADALRRLAHWLERALVEPKPRKATRPSGLGRTREKSHRSEIKQARRFKPDDWDA